MHPLRPKMTYNAEIVRYGKVLRSVVKCKSQSTVVTKDVSYSHEHTGYHHVSSMRERAYTRCAIYKRGWPRNGSYVETTVVGCIATTAVAATVSWPVTGDSYAVDITIMECVRLPLCLSPKPCARLCLYPYRFPITNPTLSLSLLWRALPEQVPRLKQCCNACAFSSSSSLRFTHTDLFRIIQKKKKERKNRVCRLGKFLASHDYFANLDLQRKQHTLLLELIALKLFPLKKHV